MDTAGQLPAFLICAMLGIATGLLYDLLRPLRFCKISEAFADVAFFLLSAAVYVAVATKCAFPDFRVFVYFAFAAGFIIYSKSLRRVVAFFQKICYNKCEKWKNTVFRAVLKKKKREERKNQEKKRARL